MNLDALRPYPYAAIVAKIVKRYMQPPDKTLNAHKAQELRSFTVKSMVSGKKSILPYDVTLRNNYRTGGAGEYFL